MTKSSSPRVLDSLALAYSLSGEPAKAAVVQRQAIELLGEGDPELRAELEEKLTRYLQAAEEAGLELEQGPVRSPPEVPSASRVVRPRKDARHPTTDH